MRTIIKHLSIKRKSYLSQTTNDANHNSFEFKKPSLPPIQHHDSNLQKRAWFLAVAEECRLKGNETPVLEALTFFTDPIYGHGEPSIGAIQEKCAQKGVYIHYDTVRQCLKRLQQKGAISIEFRGMKLTCHYRLIGFEYKSESCYRETLNNINSASLPKGERSRSKIKNICKAPLAAVCSYALPQEEERPSTESVKNWMKDIRKANLERIV